MKLHITEPLFGLDAFTRPENSVPPATTADPEPADEPSTPGAETAKDGSETGFFPAEALPKTNNSDDSLQTTPAAAAASLSLHRMAAGITIFLLLCATGLSLFSLAMKTQRRAVSYELARQTRIFSRISKHRAMLELEYAYLRSTNPMLEDFTRRGWREITPHEVRHVKWKASGNSARKGQNPW